MASWMPPSANAREDQFALIGLDQRHHAVGETVGEYGALYIVVFADTVVAAGGVHHPVADVDQIKKTAELLFRQINFHSDASFDGTENLLIGDYSTRFCILP